MLLSLNIMLIFPFTTTGLKLGQTLITVNQSFQAQDYTQPFWPYSGLTPELTLSYDPRGAHFSMALFPDSSAKHGSAEPGNAPTNWTGMASYRADYCHSSSGDGDSTGESGSA